MKVEMAPVEIWPAEQWQQAEIPEQVGWSAEKLDRAFAYADKIGSAAIMIVDDGTVVDTWGDVTRNYQCHSMRKSLLSALYGIYVDDGKIELDATLADLEIDDKNPLTEMEKEATVVDLLEARSGVYLRAAGESDSMKANRPERGSHPPGTFWYYNNWDFNALGTIFDMFSGEENIYQAFKKRIADPIGMQDYRPKKKYTYESYSIHPYYGFRMSTRDLARFGLLFLREGRWDNEQIISSEWVHESTASHSERGQDSGYGYMWWTGEDSGVFPHVLIKEHIYWAWGYNAHLVIVMPYRNLVIVHREDTDQTNPPVITEAQFGALLWMILDAVGDKDIGEPPPTIEFAAGKRLTAEEIYDTLAGSTLDQKDSVGEIDAAFTQDGVISIFLDDVLVDDGTWWTEDDKLCVEFTKPEMGGGCVYVVMDGMSVSLYGLDGLLTDVYTYSKGQAPDP
ncbi:MAG: serine hydrolase [Chloroflexota bacterium]|nr:serine hydrolase [Chloroflexota bacterium]